MKQVRLTPQARAEIAEIRLYTRKRWGAAQADPYLRGLGRRFEEIAAGTASHRDAEIGGDYRRCGYESHIIVFRFEGDAVKVVHVFHRTMDIPGRMTGDR
ncbi:MAG: toxin ParE1/3/4 [Sphingomonadales bacterium]|nr:toxin ParE1/3/4 [Sphingomonadales bacterium]